MPVPHCWKKRRRVREFQVIKVEDVHKHAGDSKSCKRSEAKERGFSIREFRNLPTWTAEKCGASVFID